VQILSQIIDTLRQARAKLCSTAFFTNSSFSPSTSTRSSTPPQLRRHQDLLSNSTFPSFFCLRLAFCASRLSVPPPNHGRRLVYLQTRRTPVYPPCDVLHLTGFSTSGQHYPMDGLNGALFSHSIYSRLLSSLVVGQYFSKFDSHTYVVVVLCHGEPLMMSNATGTTITHASLRWLSLSLSLPTWLGTSERMS
jgi:hypothetical protein